MAKTTRKRHTIIDEMMNEPIHMVGFGDLIVTRDFAYQWLSDCGWDRSERGFGSLDYIVFSAKKAEYDLTDPAIRDRWLAEVRHDYLRGELAA